MKKLLILISILFLLVLNIATASSKVSDYNGIKIYYDRNIKDITEREITTLLDTINDFYGVRRIWFYNCREPWGYIAGRLVNYKVMGINLCAIRKYYGEEHLEYGILDIIHHELAHSYVHLNRNKKICTYEFCIIPYWLNEETIVNSMQYDIKWWGKEWYNLSQKHYPERYIQ